MSKKTFLISLFISGSIIIFSLYHQSSQLKLPQAQNSFKADIAKKQTANLLPVLEKFLSAPKKTANYKEEINQTSSFSSPDNQNNSTENHSTDLQNSKQTTTKEKNDKTKEEIKQYLINSSNLNFPDPSYIQLAISLVAEKGEKTELKNIIKEMNEKYEELELLSHPAELDKIHEQSLNVIQRFIPILQQIVDLNNPDKIKVDNIINSTEMQQINELANQVLKEIRQVVKEYNISLPAGILPE